MSGEVGRYIRIQNPDGAGGWHTIPNGDKVAVWEHLFVVAPNEATGIDERRIVFHVNRFDSVRRGSRVSYLGNRFIVLSVSDSKRLAGLELCCAPDTSPAEPMEMSQQPQRR